MEELDTAQWYVLQVMSGQENRVCKSLQYRTTVDQSNGIDNGIIEVVVPTERIEERKGSGKKVVRDRKLYPGYVLIKVRLFDSEDKLIPETWGLIRETNGIIGFIGGEHPVPLPQEEIDKMLQQGAEENVAPKPAVEFTLGETVVIREGAFENIEGTVVKIDQIRQILGVSINMFGSSTIVEIDYRQVDRSVQ
ncbi:MAG: transcription termination/antitermination factor NusG [Lentisphaerae bacterium]|jgi:transcriptional antiterminator NusG|nr:transcription termination/antitermination factor NusG [Lentisphaerota bacterium]